MLAATKTTLFTLTQERDQWRPSEVFRAENIARVAEAPGLIVVASGDGALMLLSGDGRSEKVAAIDEPIESLLILDPGGPEVLIGTEGAHLLLFEGRQVGHVESFDQLDCRSRWHTPWGGPAAVRSLAAAPDGWIYADIHVGSIMRSADRGRSWKPVAADLHEDVHQVATCPVAPARVYANTADGIWISDDRGQSWRHRAKDLHNRYGRAVAAAPDNGDVILATVSDGPHGQDVHGQLWRSEDAGRTWRHVTDGFPASTQDNINTHHVAFAPDGLAWAVVGKVLYVSSDTGRTWREAWQAPEPIEMLAAPALFR